MACSVTVLQLVCMASGVLVQALSMAVIRSSLDHLGTALASFCTMPNIAKSSRLISPWTRSGVSGNPASLLDNLGSMGRARVLDEANFYTVFKLRWTKGMSADKTLSFWGVEIG